MNTETLDYKGYKITVAQEDCPENPFESWDCEPPLLTYYSGRHGYFKAYKGAPEDWFDILRLLPESVWTRKNRVAFLKEFILPLGLSMRDFAEERRRVGYFEAVAVYLGEHLGAKPEGWRSAIEWFECAESLLKWAGIECVNTQSNGYSQGDSTLVLAIATPEWVKLVGCAQENAKAACECAVELYGAWAWGDVYGVSEIHAPSEDEETEGEEIENGSCWGFYGRNHEKSGLMEHARDAIDYHIRQVAETALNEPACLI